MDQLRRADQGYQNHKHCIRQRAIEGIEKARIEKSVVWLMALLVDPWVHLVLQAVHYILQAIL